MQLPANDSPFWPILRDLIRLIFTVIFGMMIYSTVDFHKDFLMIIGILLGNGLVSGGTGIIKMLTKKGNDNDGDSNATQNAGSP